MKEIFTLSAMPLLILWRFLILTAMSMFIVWFYSVIRIQFSKLKVNNLRISIKYSILEGLLLLFVFFSTYMIAFFYFNGWQRFVWDSWIWSYTNTYFMIAPEIILFLLINILFFVQIATISKITK